MWLRQSTASQEISLGQFLDSTDGNTEEDGLTIANTDIKLRKGGATTLASKNSGGATNISNGVYYATLDATDTNTLGLLEVYVHVAGALATKSSYIILPATSYDALVTNGLNNLGGTAQTADHTAAIADIPTVAEFNARTLVAAGYFDPATDTVANVTLVTTTTTNSDMRGTDSANTVVPPSVAQFDARTILSANYALEASISSLNDFNPTSDAVANVTLVATTTTNTDMRGTNSALLAASYTAPDNASITSILADTNELQLNQGNWLTATGFSTSAEIAALNDLSFNDVWTGTLTEDYAADGAAITPAQGVHMIWSDLRSPQQVSTTWTDFRLNNTTASMTFTLDDATTPTKKTRAT